jgi:hypothetical protein
MASNKIAWRHYSSDVSKLLKADTPEDFIKIAEGMIKDIEKDESTIKEVLQSRRISINYYSLWSNLKGVVTGIKDRIKGAKKVMDNVEDPEVASALLGVAVLADDTPNKVLGVLEKVTTSKKISDVATLLETVHLYELLGLLVGGILFFNPFTLGVMKDDKDKKEKMKKIKNKVKEIAEKELVKEPESIDDLLDLASKIAGVAENVKEGNLENAEKILEDKIEYKTESKVYNKKEDENDVDELGSLLGEDPEKIIKMIKEEEFSDKNETSLKEIAETIEENTEQFLELFSARTYADDDDKDTSEEDEEDNIPKILSEEEELIEAIKSIDGGDEFLEEAISVVEAIKQEAEKQYSGTKHYAAKEFVGKIKKWADGVRNKLVKFIDNADKSKLKGKVQAGIGAVGLIFLNGLTEFKKDELKKTFLQKAKAGGVIGLLSGGGFGFIIGVILIGLLIFIIKKGIKTSLHQKKEEDIKSKLAAVIVKLNEMDDTKKEKVIEQIDKIKELYNNENLDDKDKIKKMASLLDDLLGDIESK